MTLVIYVFKMYYIKCVQCLYVFMNIYVPIFQMKTIILIMVAVLIAFCLAVAIIYMRLLAFFQGLSSVQGRSNVLMRLQLTLSCERDVKPIFL